MGYSDEWKYILREELPYYMDARIDNEPFSLVVHPRLLKELTKTAGSLQFTPQILVDGVNYHFKCSTILRRTDLSDPFLANRVPSRSEVDYSTWYLWKTVRDPRSIREQQSTYIGNAVAGWYSSHIAIVTSMLGLNDKDERREWKPPT